MISSSPTRRGINIFADEGAPVVAVNDGVIRKIGHSERARQLRRPRRRLRQPLHLRRARQDRPQPPHGGDADRQGEAGPGRQREHPPAPLRAARARAERARRQAASERGRRGRRDRRRRHACKVGSKVIAGTVLARVGGGDGRRSTRTSTSRSARPAGARRGSTRSRSSTAGSCSRRRRSTAPRARARSPRSSSGAGVLLLSKEALQQRVLADKRLEIYECGREDIATGQIDRRVLAMLEYLRRTGLRADDHLAQVRPRLPHHLRQRLQPHAPATRSTSRRSTASRCLGNQGPGTLTDELIRRRCCACRGRWHPTS